MSDKTAAPDVSPDKRVNVEGTGGVMTDVSPDKRVDVEGTGGVMPVSDAEHQDIEKSVNVTGEPTKTWSEDKNAPGVTKEKGEHVNTDVNFHGSAEKTADKIPGPDVPDAPDTLDVTKPLMEDGKVGDPTKTWSENHNADPVTQDTGDFNTVKKDAAAEGRKHALASMKLAETEIELGILDAGQKHERAAELEGEEIGTIEAQIETLSKVRTAGLRKPVNVQRTAATRLPSMRGSLRTAATEEAPTVSPDSPDADAALFL